MKIALIREGKIPTDKRVALTPEQCIEAKEKFPEIEIVVQKSYIRCFKDSEYVKAGFEVKEDISDCDVLLGIKEVPVNELINRKTYFFFSHTTKKQPYNRNLLLSLLNNKIRMIDYEPLIDDTGQRVIAFGRFAGLVGAYNGIIGYGIKHNLFELKPAHDCFDLHELSNEFEKVKLPNIKIVVTGNGRVAKGAMEILDGMKIKKVSPKEYLENDFDEAVYTQLKSKDYHFNKNNKAESFDNKHFYENSKEYGSSFNNFIGKTNLLIAAAFWHPDSPVLFTKDQMREDDFKIEVIADITCDIEGSIPSTLKPSSIDAPFYAYNPSNEKIEPAFTSKNNVTVMAVDNLPNELPRDASESFGKQFIDYVFPSLLNGDKNSMLERATITMDGKLTKPYQYLQGYADGTE